MSIWKTTDLENAALDKQILFYAGGSCFPYLGWHYPQKGFGTWDYKDIQKWAYLEDVLAQADKAKRLQKAVDLIANMEQRLCIDDPVDILYDVLKIAKDEIKQLTKE